jgi:hypothetical protein
LPSSIPARFGQRCNPTAAIAARQVPIAVIGHCSIFGIRRTFIGRHGISEPSLAGVNSSKFVAHFMHSLCARVAI